MGIGSADNFYALLGVDAGADGAELRRVWRRLVLQWHPDRAGPASTATFQTLLAAYMVLSDPSRGPRTIGGRAFPSAAPQYAPAMPRVRRPRSRSLVLPQCCFSG
jgi:hypothetical protein